MSPHFTAQIGNLEKIGPITEIKVLIPLALEEMLTNKGESIPSPVKGTALIDTGATKTAMATGIADKLGLKPVGTQTISTASSKDFPCSLYSIRVLFPNNVGVGNITAIEAPLNGIDFLIGRDILTHAVLVYIGYLNQFTLSF